MEFRRFQRFPVKCPIAFAGDANQGQGKVLNLSKLGCAVGSSKPVKEGEYLNVNVLLADQPAPLKVELAVVRWTAGRWFGLEFIRMQPEMQNRLGRFIQALEMPPKEEVEVLVS